MTPSGLVKLFGANTPWVLCAIGLFLASVVVAAFRQGRAISIWPPQIGARPAGAREGAPSFRPAPHKGHAAGVDRVYAASRARRFYQEIARNYDLRNSGNLVATHLATVALLQEIRARLPQVRVLDLGGGTGKLIAVHFFNDDKIKWTYVDFCPAMAAELRRNLAGCPLGRNMEVIVDDFQPAVRDLPPASYDVVMLSLVLSSLPAPPDFGPIAALLAPGGSLIVTDINPGYTRDKPLYKVAVHGTVLALRTTPVDPYEVIRRAVAAGLRATEHKMLGEGNTYYSFMTVFTPAQVGAADEHQVAPALAAENLG
jgi:SAM-dependent methyltransferase